MRMALIGSAAGFLLVALAAVYYLGRAHEAEAQAAAQMAMQEAYLAQRDRADEAERQRLIIQGERNRLALELEHAARTDSDAGRVSLPSRSVQRLGAR